MKRKVLGVLIALFMVSVFVGCDDPSSEKPGINYKDSGFVGTWVHEEVKEWDLAGTGYGKFITTYALYDDGNGVKGGEIIPCDILGNAEDNLGAEEAGDEYVVWYPLSNGTVSLEYDGPYLGSTIQEIGILSDDGLSFTLEDGSDYTKQ